MQVIFVDIGTIYIYIYIYRQRVSGQGSEDPFSKYASLVDLTLKLLESEGRLSKLKAPTIHQHRGLRGRVLGPRC